jgi:hypothetical protein
MDKDSLNDLCKKYNVSFPVGMIQADEEKARFAWGVKSLPWLILADREQVVLSNGFSLGEMDNYLKE